MKKYPAEFAGTFVPIVGALIASIVYRIVHTRAETVNSAQSAVGREAMTE